MKLCLLDLIFLLDLNTRASLIPRFHSLITYKNSNPSITYSCMLFPSLSLSVQEGEELDKSAELLTFHEAINNLVESEEQLVEEHKAIIQVWEGTRGI